MVLKQPIFKAFSDLKRAKIAQNGLKIGLFHLFVHPKWPKIFFLEKPILGPFFTHFGPKTAHFQGIL